MNSKPCFCAYVKAVTFALRNRAQKVTLVEGNDERNFLIGKNAHKPAFVFAKTRSGIRNKDGNISFLQHFFSTLNTH